MCAFRAFVLQVLLNSFTSEAMNMVLRMSRDVADAFWSRLPNDEFAEEEAELLDMLQKLGSLLDSWLPPGISLQDWVQRRVPQELALDINASRLAYLASTTFYTQCKCYMKSLDLKLCD